ncbi:hypothetical protein BUZ08_13725 [Staphylococcus gallinarum]|nr:hypothetical protein BUZ08_13725 [Staphylococcus gallinarum]RIO77458.1 LPXTG cell wall anchor domain-containing protein [Staphylococcus gallinarum]
MTLMPMRIVTCIRTNSDSDEDSDANSDSDMDSDANYNNGSNSNMNSNNNSYSDTTSNGNSQNINQQDRNTLPDTGEANNQNGTIFGSLFAALGSLLLFRRRNKNHENK